MHQSPPANHLTATLQWPRTDTRRALTARHCSCNLTRCKQASQHECSWAKHSIIWLPCSHCTGQVLAQQTGWHEHHGSVTLLSILAPSVLWQRTVCICICLDFKKRNGNWRTAAIAALLAKQVWKHCLLAGASVGRRMTADARFMCCTIEHLEVAAHAVGGLHLVMLASVRLVMCSCGGISDRGMDRCTAHVRWCTELVAVNVHYRRLSSRRESI